MTCDKEHIDGFSFQTGKYIDEKTREILGFIKGYNASNQYLKVNSLGTGIEMTPHVQDSEYRNLLQVLAGKNKFRVQAGDVIEVTSINSQKIGFVNENGVYRNLKHSEQNLIYRRVDSNVLFSDEYDPSKSNLVSGTYSFDAKIEILQTGYYATGWIDFYDMEDAINSQNSAGTIGSSTDADLPIPNADGQVYWVTDQLFHVYSKNGSWYKLSDDSLWKNLPTRDIDMYILLGQSNMHGNADLTGASTDITDAKSDVFFRTAWHDNTSNATTPLYESAWVDNVTAGNTRGDDGVSTIGGSSKFGPEIGFAHEGKTNGLFGNNTPAIFKYAVGGSALHFDTQTASNTDISDWDTDDNLANRNGDCWRNYKIAFENALQDLRNKGHRVFVKGVVWYQGESDGPKATPEGTIETKLKKLWDKLRQHLLSQNITTDFTKMVVTRISDSAGEPVSWGDEYKRLSDKYTPIGLVDATIYSPGNNIHLDTDGMFGIGKAFAREMYKVLNQGSDSIAHEIAGSDLIIGASSTESNVTLTSGFVTQVDDLSTSSNNFTAKTGSSIEHVDTGSDLLYNEKVFKCDGDVDILDSGQITSLNLGSKLTIYMLFNPTSVNGPQDSPFSIKDSNPFDNITPLSGDFSSWKGQWLHSTRPEGFQAHLGTTAITGWNLITWEIDTTAQTNTAWINGTQIFSVTDTGTLGANSKIQLMGNHNAPSGVTGASTLDGKWTEFICTRDNSDREKIEGAIMHRYGLARLLPANHAYREIVP